jgi:hypothetical protein
MATRLKTGGRVAGTPNKTTAALKEAAQLHADDALATIAELMNSKTTPHAVRLNAANMLLERGYGKSREELASMNIMDRFINQQISALQAALELEAHGLKVGDVLGQYVQAEVLRIRFKPLAAYGLDTPPDLIPLPDKDEPLN